MQNCDVMRYYYFMILKDQCWVISSMIYGDCCQICYSLTRRLSDRNQPNLVNLTAIREQTRVFSFRKGPNMNFNTLTVTLLKYKSVVYSTSMNSKKLFFTVNFYFSSFLKKWHTKSVSGRFMGCSRDFSLFLFFYH